MTWYTGAVRRAVMFGLALTLGCSRAEKDEPKPEPEPSAPVDPTPKSPPPIVLTQADPVPAGDMVVEPIVQAFAVYAPPGFEGDLAEIARDVRAERFDHLGLIQDPEKGDYTLPGVNIVVPPVGQFAPIDAESLKYFGRGLSAEELEAAPRSQSVVTLTFVSERADSIQTHADALRMTLAVARSIDGFCWDDDTRELFGLEAWKERADTSVDDPRKLPSHITIHIYPEGESMRLITLGMAKFGLPDIVVEEMPETTIDAMSSLVHLAASTIMAAPALMEAGRLPVDVATVGATPAPGARGKTVLELVVAQPQPGDPENVLVELAFPEQNRQAAQAAVLDAVFGASGD